MAVLLSSNSCAGFSNTSVLIELRPYQKAAKEMLLVFVSASM